MRDPEVIHSDDARTVTRYYSDAGYSDVTTWTDPPPEPPKPADLAAQARAAVAGLSPTAATRKAVEALAAAVEAAG